MTVEISIVADEVAFSQRVELDGVFFRLTFRWNDRATLWMLDVEDDDGADVVVGMALVTGVPVNLGSMHGEAVPNGIFLVFDSEGRGGTPAVDDLGTRFKVFFTPLAELRDAA